MRQPSLTEIEYSLRKKVTKREDFLKIIGWRYPVGRMGRVCKAILSSLSDEGIEDAIYDSYAFRYFMKINFFDEQVPDATTLLKFRHLLEKNNISQQFFQAINRALEAGGWMMRGGTIVDATIIQAPASTKNATGKRDPEMKSTRKGQQYYFGLKAHAGVDAGSGYVHTPEVTPANVHDSVMGGHLIRDDDHPVYGDSGCLGISEQKGVKADSHLSSVDYRINRRPSSVKKAGARLILKKTLKRGNHTCVAKWNIHFFWSKNFLLMPRQGKGSA